MVPAKTILIVSHRRSGTHWTIDAIRHNFPDVGKSIVNLDRLLPWHHDPLSLHQFKSLLIAESRTLLIKTHVPFTLEPFQVDIHLAEYIRSLLANSKVVYVYRDGRDVLVSLYYYMKEYDLTARDIRFSEFIRMKNEFHIIPNGESKLNRVEYWQFHLEGWLKQARVHPISYENMHENYPEIICRAADYLEMEPDKRIKRIEHPVGGSLRRVRRALVRAARMIGIGRAGESSAILPRGGRVGEWERHFSEKDIQFFNEICGDLLENLGYSGSRNLVRTRDTGISTP